VEILPVRLERVQRNTLPQVDLGQWKRVNLPQDFLSARWFIHLSGSDDGTGLAGTSESAIRQ
jgi:hypothetical protein